MNLLPLQSPPELLQLEALTRRYRQRDEFYEKIENNYHREKAGYLGEKALQYYFNLLKHDSSFTLFDLRAKANTHYFQIDALLITRQFILIVESKHTKGVITQNNAKQMIQHVNGESKALQHPLHQAEIQRRQLENFLITHELNHLPIFICSTFTHPEVILDMQDQPDNLFTHHYLLQHIYDLIESHSTPIISEQLARKIGLKLRHHHTPRNRHLADYYKLSERDFIRGVFCSECGAAGMKRIYANWECFKCHKQQNQAHIAALQDLIYLKQEIYFSNQQVRDWLNLESEHTCRRLLNLFPKIGSYKGTKYNLSSLIPNHFINSISMRDGK
ncbi:nuclease-related domain-containing protein [Alkalibacillus salilacus]|uniref:NERD domain-containing protein n=1 Tax=Alkalibacillus salilacus TaxID=284582 RepID=A0ABT9VHY7_9BACI|nr:nuclease-related domain-containing protein [Alkalibacillus salilacus]MDQ0160502.1 hypothetical protein [Alkalibacillus salilacus]